MKIGDSLIYHPQDGEIPGPHPGDEGLAALVCAINEDGSVNLCVFNIAGTPHSVMNFDALVAPLVVAPIEPAEEGEETANA